MSLELAFYGGSLIALSSSLNYILFGNITGLSGILNVVLSPQNIKHEFYPLRLSFVIGLVSVIKYWLDTNGPLYEGKSLVSENDDISILGWMVGGVLIGIGTRWGGGCTSGHGVCGLPRLSIRSFIAVCIFMPSGMITATYLKAFPVFFTNSRLSHEFYENYLFIAKSFLIVLQGAFGLIFVYFMATKEKIKKTYPLFQFAFGWIFGLGLMLSGMCSRAKILGFLTISENWDPSLLVVMFTAVFINFVTFQGIILYGKPIFENKLQMPVKGVELGTFVGPALFGIGWGITGLCPGPAMANLIVNPNCFLLIATIYAGQKLVDSMYEIASKFKKD